jgi:short-subunit dehydrogenase
LQAIAKTLPTVNSAAFANLHDGSKARQLIGNRMQKVIIIGATSGIGFELAKLYAQNGDRIGATGRRDELLQKLKQLYPDQVVTECFDVMENENIRHLESLIQKLNGLDLIIYNSGYGDISDALNWTIDKQTTQINVVGFVEIVNYAFNYFVKQGKGQIAATSSIGALRGNSQAPAYSASKAYMSTYMEGLHLKALRLKRKDPKIDIGITDIQPGFVKTTMAKGKGIFWQAPVEKAAKQIFNAIQKRRRKAFITRRWAIIAWILKWLPYSILKRFA